MVLNHNNDLGIVADLDASIACQHCGHRGWILFAFKFGCFREGCPRTGWHYHCTVPGCGCLPYCTVAARRPESRRRPKLAA